jgi:hypothetical protein
MTENLLQLVGWRTQLMRRAVRQQRRGFRPVEDAHGEKTERQ